MDHSDDQDDQASEKAYDGFDQEAATRIQNLARTLSISSSIHSNISANVYDDIPGVSPFDNGLTPKLDPNTDKFDSRMWVMNLQKMMDSNPKYYKPTSMGVVFENLEAVGIAADADYQTTVANGVPKYAELALNLLSRRETSSFDILKPMDGLLKPGKVCVVLGKPGAGCTTFLKSIAAQTYGFHLSPKSEISYDGLTSKEIHKSYRGEVVYCAETENHFPHLTVGDTLKFAAKMRAPENRPEGVTRDVYAQHMTDVIMATYGLSHTKNTRVGDDYIRGVSGGERKRVSICEVALSGAKVQCWDNSTRGLDSATALEFIKALKTSAVVSKTTPIIAIYQCSQVAYDLFDTVQLLYEGYQIYFGDAKKAKDYFLEMGYECPARQTTADYLTSITSPGERKAKPGYENKVPKSPKEFYDYWRNSLAYKELMNEIEEYKQGETTERANVFKEAHVARQAKHLRSSSPFTVSFLMQVRYITYRNYLRVKGDPSIPIFTIVSHIIIALFIGSVYYNLQNNTTSLTYRASALFFALLLNAMSCLLEIFALYEARPIVEKHKTYALYHPAADALASIIAEFPVKIIVAIVFNIPFYFLVNFKIDAGAFFFYLLTIFTATLCMSHVFRTIGAATRTVAESMAPATIVLLALAIFTGFIVPIRNMHGWCRWINYLDPIGYAFEALVVNEFHRREFPCTEFIPRGGSYPTSGNNIVCSSVSAIAGFPNINGDEFVYESYEYKWDHRWRNWGIVVGFSIFFLCIYITLCEYNKGAMQKGEILLFQKSTLRKLRKQHVTLDKEDLEVGTSDEKIDPEQPVDSEQLREQKLKDTLLPQSSDIFHWRNLTYEVKIKSENRVILNEVSGFVKPGTVTALMGASGAGKTTLLNALSARLTSGVITNGTRMVNGRPLDKSFQRSIGYVQQQDLHLETSTVREALNFSAELRQPASVPRQEKLEYVEYIIGLLEMEKFADAVVGVAGEGLNVEQRKRLTIGVELVAKPELLVFLDEPTSGLDSQTAWSICKLIRKLADHGQAILCTIHQPSAILMQQFDRLLFLQRGGKTVYFGDLGKDCQTMIKYFEKYGAPECPPEANPVEWMLEVIGAAPGSHASQDYFDVWKNSTEYKALHDELDNMERELPEKMPLNDNPEKYKSYAASVWKQYLFVTQRVFQQTWRTPTYIYSKIALSVFSALFNGFVFFKADNSLQGLQTQMFAIFMLLVLFLTLIQQYIPYFVLQRDLYEVRERPSKTFGWLPFITAQITSEIPWQIVTGTLTFFCWYYPIGYASKASVAGELHKRGALMWITIVLYYIYVSTMAQVCISFFETAENAANLGKTLFIFCLMFCGVLVTPTAMPGFWIFMYRVNPITYVVSAMISIGASDNPVECSKLEFSVFVPPQGMNCLEYMTPFMNVASGYLSNETINSTVKCEFCKLKDTTTYLKSVGVDPSKTPRNIGVFSVYIFFDMIGTVFLYWLARVPKGHSKHAA